MSLLKAFPVEIRLPWTGYGAGYHVPGLLFCECPWPVCLVENKVATPFTVVLRSQVVL